MYIKQIPETDYNIFCQKFDEATFFHSIEWHHILRAAYNIELLYLGIYKTDELVGVIPVMRRKMFGLNIYGAPLPKSATPTILPLLNQTKTSAALEAIDQWVKDNGWKHLQISWPLDSPVFLNNVKEELRLLVKIDVCHPLEVLWRQIKRETRNRIRYAVRSKIRVHTCISDTYLDEYKRLLHYTYNLSQAISPNTSPSIFDEIRKRKTELPLKVFTATYKNTVVAMLWIFFDKDTCYFWEGASDAKGKELAANHLLHWEVIRWASKKGIKHYDMVGGKGRGGKRDGILSFKQQFGASTEECKVLYWQSKWVKLLFRTYRGYLYIKDRPTK